MNPFLKRKTTDKVDCPPKKPKVVTGSTIRETPPTTQLRPMPRSGKRKGLMMGDSPVSKKHLVLLYEDLQYAIGQFSSIINANDY